MLMLALNMVTTITTTKTQTSNGSTPPAPSTASPVPSNPYTPPIPRGKLVVSPSSDHHHYVLSPPQTPEQAKGGRPLANFSSSSPSSDSPALDPYVAARMPGGKPPLPRKPDIAPKPSSLQPLTPTTKLEHPEWMSFSEKKRHFEIGKKKGQQRQQQQQPTSTLTTSTSSSSSEQQQTTKSSSETSSSSEQRNFSYLSQSELEKLREEEVKKLSTFSEQQLRSIMSADEEDSEGEEEGEFERTLENGNNTTTTSITSSSSTTIEEEKKVVDENGGSRRTVFRTAKAERLYHAKMGLDVDSAEYLQMTPGQRRAAEAEKRKEWRQARLKSLEDDPTMTLLNMKNYDHWAEQIEEDEVLGGEGGGGGTPASAAPAAVTTADH